MKRTPRKNAAPVYVCTYMQAIRGRAYVLYTGFFFFLFFVQPNLTRL